MEDGEKTLKEGLPCLKDQLWILGLSSFFVFSPPGLAVLAIELPWFFQVSLKHLPKGTSVTPQAKPNR